MVKILFLGRNLSYLYQMDERDTTVYKKKFDQSYYTNRHSCFLLTYHLVLVTKYRHPILVDGVKGTVYSTISDILKEKCLNLISMNGEADHVHVLFEAGPEICLLDLVNVIKTKTARFARRDNAEFLQKYYWKPYFWTDSYFVSTAGNTSKSVLQEYIKNQ